MNCISPITDIGYHELLKLMSDDDLPIVKFDGGEQLYEQGQPIERIYWIIEGSVIIKYSAENGKSFNHGLMVCKNRFFGEVELLAGTGANFDLYVKGSTEVKVLSAKYFRRILLENPMVNLWLSKEISKKLNETITDSFNRTLYPLAYNIAVDVKKRSTGNVEQKSFPTVPNESERFGCSERVYRRVISELVNKKLITKRNGVIEIVDEDDFDNFIKSYN